MKDKYLYTDYVHNFTNILITLHIYIMYVNACVLVNEITDLRKKYAYPKWILSLSDICLLFPPSFHIFTFLSYFLSAFQSFMP